MDHWRWALPSTPVSLATLGLVSASAELTVTDSKTGAREGIAAIYESTRHEFGQGYAVFRPARRVA